jgi:GAF domain-containing protein
VVRRRTPREFEKNTVDLIKTFAAQSALAIQNARLFHEIEDKSRQPLASSRTASRTLSERWFRSRAR